MTNLTKTTKELEVSALKRALAVERRARYVDFEGRRTTFSHFMRQTAGKLCRRYPVDARWATIRGLFAQYPNLDVATRIAIVRRVEELLVLEPTSNEPVSTSSKEKNEHRSHLRTDNVNQRPQAPSTQAKMAMVQTDELNSLKAKKSSTLESDEGKQIQGTTQSQKERKKASLLTVDGPGEVEVKFVRGVGPKMASLLNHMGIYTVSDLLHHYPRRHLDFQNRLMIRELRPGQEVTVFGTIASVGAFQAKRGNVSIVNIVIRDQTGSITTTRFIGGKSNKFLLDRYKSQFPKGAQVLASGVVEVDGFKGRLCLKGAEIELLGALGSTDDELETIHTGRLVPVYPLTEGVSLRYLRFIVHNALESYGNKLEEPLPESLLSKYNLINLPGAIKSIHFPQDPEDCAKARRRIVFDELFALQLLLQYRRQRDNMVNCGLALPFSQTGMIEQFRKSLPFVLTSAQERVFREIAQDLASTKPMHRLVQGDVGSGKTVVAMMAFLVAIENGYQGAMMAPTEILAEQHYNQFQKFLTPLGLRCALILGKQGQKERRLLQQDLLSGQVHLAVGTHALIQEGVEFANLGLIIIDEQHRFGVKQRAQLKAKGQNPELLTMTATPIPRTLALTLHGDLDVSEIDELPPGRKPVETQLVTPGNKKELWQFLKKEIEAGRQAYIVFPLIEESETLSAKAATAEYEKLKAGVFKELRVGLIHGKLKAQEKDEVMDKFRQGEFDILVATTVIEVGVDVPNASVMVIENADRFGLAQLHQLRGRVGRGNFKSFCFLIAEMKSSSTRQRLEIMTQTNDGFVVAQKDLELRGPGEFLGVRQSGLPDLFLADLVQDAKILEEARNAAIELIRHDPELKNHRLLKAQVEKALRAGDGDLVGSG